MSTNDNIISYTYSSHLEITDNSSCVIDGLKGIASYSSDKIKVNLGKFCVTFFGDNLFINAFSLDGAIIEGTIVSLEFESNG